MAKFGEVLSSLVVVLLLLVASVDAWNVCRAISGRKFTQMFEGENPPSGWVDRSFRVNDQWKSGTFPLSSCPSCVMRGPVSTTYLRGESTVATRTSVKVVQNARNAKLKVRVGNRAWVWINGKKVGDVKNQRRCVGSRGFPFKTLNIPDSVLRKGWNLIAVKARAESDNAYLDIQFTVEQEEPCFKAAVLECAVIGPGKSTKMLTIGRHANKPRGYGEVGFDDSAWEMTNFPVGKNLHKCGRLACLETGGFFDGAESKIITRTTFVLNSLPNREPYLRVLGLGAWIRLNNEKIGDLTFKKCKHASRGKFFKVPRSILRVGENVLAIVAAGDRKSASILLPELVVRGNRCPPDSRY